ncbi:S-methyl-5'-thioadenosine phosphorylase [candidate division KSB1 bacterium]|nr:MAG: S-methyl-5'-thioadenosine phosphorylase [candidate division KSB1 bacterium]
MSSKIGIIGGSGLYQMDEISSLEWISVDTPFGEPSDKLALGKLNEKEVVFLPRHGRNHTYLPSEINYRANIYAMKSLGVTRIISVSAVGSFKKDIMPRDIVLIDQFIDRTKGTTPSTFFGDGVVAHISFAQPVCQDLRQMIYEAGQEEGFGAKLHFGGTYLNMEGPAFSTKAESLLYKSWNVDVIGMTNLYEAKLAREAEICYATMAMVTDYDSWMETGPDSEVTVQTVIENLQSNTVTAKKIIKNVVDKISEQRTCSCKTALENSILTNIESISQKAKDKLGIILEKYCKG